MTCGRWHRLGRGRGRSAPRGGAGGQLLAGGESLATIAQERALLRMLGVDGLDGAGHPLAESVAERYCSPDRDRLATGVILPFAVALLEYDLPARELALEVASGAIDLGLEAELLERPGRLAAADAHASRLLAAALARFDANRTATRDLSDVLGFPDEPWLGVTLNAAEVAPAAEETRGLVGEGAEVVQICVPASWEFAEARRQAGLETPGLFGFEARTEEAANRSRGRRSVRASGRTAPRRRGASGDPSAAVRARPRAGRQPARPGRDPKGGRQRGRRTRLLRQPHDRGLRVCRARTGCGGGLRAGRSGRSGSDPRDRRRQRRSGTRPGGSRFRELAAGSGRLPW